MKYKVFIDGGEGTTGLKIHQYFQERDDIELLKISSEKRKDLEERLAFIKKADVSFLCLPDDAAKEIVAAAPKECRILDTSTAHRTADGWVYGMPEICNEQREKIRNSCRVAVPGCHATGTIMLIRPILEAGLLGKDYPFVAYSLTGYSGGGKKMIAQYESEERKAGDMFESPRQYGIMQTHKHLPEIVAMTGVKTAPSFMPIVADYYSGMEVTVPVKGVEGGREAVKKVFKEYYEGQPMVTVEDELDDGGFIAANMMSGTNKLKITVSGSDENILLVAVYDNLGKGASGAAVQNMNIMLGIDEQKGLV